MPGAEHQLIAYAFHPVALDQCDEKKIAKCL